LKHINNILIPNHSSFHDVQAQILGANGVANQLFIPFLLMTLMSGTSPWRVWG